ncbi:MAG: hypothetical protein K8T91_02115 [Planctomycetes bacterium]|nr:hypothetical protein [Planctomycetota bacterium]
MKNEMERDFKTEQDWTNLETVKIGNEPAFGFQKQKSEPRSVPGRL